MPGSPRELFERYIPKRAEDIGEWEINEERKYSKTRRKFLELRSPKEQFDFDVALWYGTLTYQDQDKLGVLRRMLSVFYYGGLFFKRTVSGYGRWHLWANTDMPLCAAISHRGRIMVQLPRLQQGETGREFFDWIKGNISYGKKKLKKRFGATHGIDYLGYAARIPLGYGRFKRLKETKKSIEGGDHWGMNIGVGGTGMINPISGQVIDDYGKHGHIYIHYLPPTFDAYGGVLFSCEPSAPYDMWSKKGRHIPLHVPDQFGGAHGIGGGQTYQVTGGMNFQNLDWEHSGPNDPKNIDNKIIDLTETGWDWIAQKPLFDKDWLGQTGRPPYEQPLSAEGPPPSIFTATYFTPHNLGLARRTAAFLFVNEKTKTMDIQDILWDRKDFHHITQNIYLKKNSLPFRSSDWVHTSSVSTGKTIRGRVRIQNADRAVIFYLNKTMSSIRQAIGEGTSPSLTHIEERLEALNFLWERLKEYVAAVLTGGSSGRIPAVGGLSLLAYAEWYVLNGAITQYQEAINRRRALIRPLPNTPPPRPSGPPPVPPRTQRQPPPKPNMPPPLPPRNVNQPQPRMRTRQKRWAGRWQPVVIKK